MIKKGMKVNGFAVAAAILSIAVLAHTYYVFYISGIQDSSGSISGNAITDIESNEKFSGIKQKIILAGEWLLIIVIFMVSLVKGKMEIKTVEEVIITPKKTRMGISKTDLDLMYDIIKEKKILKIKTLAQYFKVDDKIILEWARVLEEANLVMVHYPTVGDPVIKINEAMSNEQK